jgi:ABC-type sugar transport system substrate-binding protein
MIIAGCSPAASATPSAAPASVAAPTAAATTTSAAPASASAASSAAASPSAVSAAGIKIAVTAHLRIPYTQLLFDGAKLAATEVGAEAVIAGPQGVDPPAHVKAFNDAIATGAKGAITVAFLPDFWVAPINAAVDKGIPVYTFDIASPDSKQNVHVGPSNADLGAAIATAVAEEAGAGAKGDVVPGICVPGNPVLESRVTGFKNKLAQLAPGLVVKATADVTADPTTNLTKWQQLVQTNPTAVAFAGFCAFDLSNLVKVKEKTPTAAYKIYGTDLDPDTLRGIKAGTATQTFGQKPFVEGYLAAKLLLAQLTGGAKLSGWVDIGVEKVDKSNVDAAIAKEEAGAKGDTASVLAFYKPEIDKIVAAGQGGLRPLADISK